jgi:GrpB-like predicted nucleotidyltransferase (UPF0157 family)
VASLSHLYSPYLGDVGSPRYLDELAFRDALRGDPALAERYAALKHGLAARFPDDRNTYTQHKAPFVREVLEAFRSRS